jgi:hypothetical protein
MVNIQREVEVQILGAIDAGRIVDPLDMTQAIVAARLVRLVVALPAPVAREVRRRAAGCGLDVKTWLERAFLDALAAALDARMIEDAVREALVKLRRDGDERLGQRGALERERSLVEARTDTS